jgi:hypothetical protein
LLNSSIIHHILNPGKQRGSFTSFRINLVEKLMEDARLSDQGASQPRCLPHETSGKTLGTLPVQNSIHRKKAKHSRKYKVFADRGIHKVSTFKCHKFKVAVHVENCFVVFHLKKKMP